jgi:hypothetical protein
MKVLIILQDLRVSGTSEGIVSRSFIGKLAQLYPNAQIEVHYFMCYPHAYDKEFLQVARITEHKIQSKPSFGLKVTNAIYRRVFTKSLYQSFVIKQYRKPISNINHDQYDLVFVRSSGLEYETILALRGLPILGKAIINFHDPYPLFFDTSGTNVLTKKYLYDFKSMYEIVQDAYRCMTPSHLLSKDLQLIYGNQKKFYALPHQYAEGVFNLSDRTQVRKKQKPISISYHGGLQFGRNVDILIDAYVDIIKKNAHILEQSELVLRLKSSENKRLQEKYRAFDTIHILDGLDFSNSANEQSKEADIVLLIESALDYSNILLGKAPFVAALAKPILALLPTVCELRSIVKDDRFIATSKDQNEIKTKLEILILNLLNKDEVVSPSADYFSDENFKLMLDKVLTC